MKKPSQKVARANSAPRNDPPPPNAPPAPAPVPLEAPIEQVAAGIHPAPVPAADTEIVHVGEMPSIGRIVVVLGRYPLSPEPPGPVGKHMPAIVTGLHSPKLIDATVFPPGAAPIPCVRISFGKEPGKWCWPRQLQGE